MIPRRRWHRALFCVAGAYNILWGLYAAIDPQFQDFFREPFKSSIRLDQVEWGGVVVNGIPPLDHPKHIAPGEATSDLAIAAQKTALKTSMGIP